MAVIIQIIVALLIAGFVFWAIRQLVALIPLDPLFKRIIDVLLIILVVAIILFYVIVPLLHMLVGLSIVLPMH